MCELEWQGQQGNEFTTGGTTVWQAVHTLCQTATLAPGADADVLPSKASKGDVALVVVGEPPYAEAGGDTLLRPSPERDGRDGYAALRLTQQCPLHPHRIRAHSSHSSRCGAIAHCGVRRCRYGMLSADDAALIEAALATERRVVVVLFSGRPILLPPRLLERVS